MQPVPYFIWNFTGFCSASGYLGRKEKYMKHIIVRIIAAVLLMLGTAQAAKTDTTTAEGYKIHVVTDRPGALYSTGDSVVFNITLKKGNVPVKEGTVQVVLSNDGAGTIESKDMAITGEPLTVKGTMDKPGFLRCRAAYKLPSGKSIHALAGAGFDPEQIKASMPPPDDFDAFWADQLAQLSRVPMNAKLVPVESDNPEVEVFDVTLDCLGGMPVRGYYARPKNAKAKALPALLSLHGAGVNDSRKSYAVEKAAQGILAMDINAHGIENGKPKRFYDELAKGTLNEYRSRGKNSREEIYFRGMYLRLYRAMEFLMAQTEWDGKVLGTMGSSQGGGQALAAAGLNPKVNVFLASVPALCDHTGPINGWPRFWRPERGEKPGSDVYQAVRYIDAMNFAARTKARAVLAVGFIDDTCRPTSVYAAYNNLKGPKEMMTFPLMGHETRAEIFDGFMKRFEEEVQKAHAE